MIKVKQMEKKDTKFLDSNLKIFWKNYAKPLIILVFSCCYPITILLTSSKDFPISILVIAYHILFVLCSIYLFSQSRIIFWAKSWVSLKKVFIIILYSFKYEEMQLYRFFISHNFHQRRDSFMESYCVKYYEYKNKFFCRGRYYCAKKENKHYLLFKRKSI